MAHRRERPVDDVARGVVAAHGIDGYVNHGSSGFWVQGSGFGSRFRVQGSLARTQNREPRTEPRTLNPEPRTLVFVNRPCLAAAVIAAIRAHAVRWLRFVAMRAFAEPGRLQR